MWFAKKRDVRFYVYYLHPRLQFNTIYSKIDFECSVENRGIAFENNGLSDNGKFYGTFLGF